MAPLRVATLTVQRELPKYELALHPTSVPGINETMAPLHVATPTVQRESSLNIYELASRVSTTKNGSTS